MKYRSRLSQPANNAAVRSPHFVHDDIWRKTAADAIIRSVG